MKFNAISKTFQKNQTINNLNLVIPNEQITVLIGPSGAGKSTILNLLAGLETPTSGQISFDQKIVFDAAHSINISPAQRHLAMVFQDFALWPHMTVFQNVAFPIVNKMDPALLQQKVTKILAKVGMQELIDRYPRELSGGQQQRVAIARALIVKPKILLFDEALSALDPQLRTQLRKMIRNLIHQEHLTAVFVTHDRQEAFEIADQLAIIKDGQLIQMGTPLSIYQAPQNQFVANFVGTLNKLTAATAIRPENIRFVATPGWLAKSAKILASTFAGDHFETILQVQQYRWQVKTNQQYAPAQYTIFIDPKNILQF